MVFAFEWSLNKELIYGQVPFKEQCQIKLLMNIQNKGNNIDPIAYKAGWEKAQEEFEMYLKAQYAAKAEKALQKLKRGESFGQVIEVA